VAEADAELIAQALVERGLADVAERRVAQVVSERDRLGQVLVQRESARDGAGDPHGLERVGQPRAVVVALRRDEDLRLVLQPAERLGVDDPIAVPLEGRAQRRVVLRDRPPRRVGARGERRQLRALDRVHPLVERALGGRCLGDGHGGILPGGPAARCALSRRRVRLPPRAVGSACP
jgi:hypothetical protein